MAFFAGRLKAIQPVVMPKQVGQADRLLSQPFSSR
jgi:hypothetical protein